MVSGGCKALNPVEESNHILELEFDFFSEKQNRNVETYHQQGVGEIQ
jgi:hypothetical protein